jgi:hypothetical protein
MRTFFIDMRQIILSSKEFLCVQFRESLVFVLGTTNYSRTPKQHTEYRHVGHIIPAVCIKKTRKISMFHGPSHWTLTDDDRRRSRQKSTPTLAGLQVRLPCLQDSKKSPLLHVQSITDQWLMHRPLTVYEHTWDLTLLVWRIKLSENRPISDGIAHNKNNFRSTPTFWHMHGTKPFSLLFQCHLPLSCFPPSPLVEEFTAWQWPRTMVAGYGSRHTYIRPKNWFRVLFATVAATVYYYVDVGAILFGSFVLPHCRLSCLSYTHLERTA